MTEYRSNPLPEHFLPTLREMLAGYAQFNAWEEENQAETLPQLSMEESLRQYFELSSMAAALSADGDQVFFEQNAQHWSALRQRLERLRDVMPNGKAVAGAG